MEKENYTTTINVEAGIDEQKRISKRISVLIVKIKRTNSIA